MPQPTLSRLCAACGKTIDDFRTTGRGGRNRKYHKACDPHGRRYAPLRPRPCAKCGSEFQPKGEANTYCSAECRTHVAPPPRRLCDYCGNEFQPVNTRQRFCSLAHARAAWKNANPERDADVRRDMYHRRRARKQGSASGAPVLRGEIAERDNWTCHLCDQAIPQAVAWPDPLSLSLDHVIPLSRGGLHDPSNVKAAHLRCNVRKGDRLAA